MVYFFYFYIYILNTFFNTYFNLNLPYPGLLVSIIFSAISLSRVTTPRGVSLTVLKCDEYNSAASLRILILSSLWNKKNILLAVTVIKKVSISMMKVFFRVVGHQVCARF